MVCFYRLHPSELHEGLLFIFITREKNFYRNSTSDEISQTLSNDLRNEKIYSIPREVRDKRCGVVRGMRILLLYFFIVVTSRTIQIYLGRVWTGLYYSTRNNSTVPIVYAVCTRDEIIGALPCERGLESRLSVTEIASTKFAWHSQPYF